MTKKAHNTRNFFLCIILTYVLFLFGSATTLTILLTTPPGELLLRNTEQESLILHMSANLTLVISLVAIPLGYLLMYFFGGFLSTRIMKLYLLLTRGRHIVLPKMQEAAVRQPITTRLKLKRQITYWAFILAVVVSFATYLGRRRIPIAVAGNQPTDVSTLVTSDFITLTMTAALIIPTIALALPYLGGLRLRSIDTGPFHRVLLSTIIGISDGFALLYAFFTRPSFQYVLFYILLFMGVCWCFALGCNLAADPVNRRIIRQVFHGKPHSRLLASRIWLENPPGQLFEV